MRRSPAWWGTALAAAAIVAACSTASADRFEGKHIDVALAELGPATRIVPYPYGGTLYIWEARFREPAGVTRLTTADDQAAPPRVLVDRTALLVDEAGMVTASLHDSGPRRR